MENTPTPDPSPVQGEGSGRFADTDVPGGEGWGSLDLTGRPGVVCRADKLITSTAGLPHLASQLLADTWVVTSLDAAFTLAPGADRCRFVTLQGELLEPNGTLYIGQPGGETALVSRKIELRTVRHDLTKLDRQITSEEAALAGAVAEIDDSARALQQSQFELDLTVHRVDALRADSGAADLDAARLRRDADERQAELGQSASELDGLRPELARAEAEVGRLSDRQQQLEADVAAGESAIVEDETRLRDAQAELSALEREFARDEERLQGLSQARTRLDEERLQRDLHREEADRRLRHLSEKHDQIALEIMNTTAALGELAARKDVLAADTLELKRERELARRMRGELAERELQARHQLRDRRERAHALEMQMTDLRHQLTGLADRLREEFQVELAEAAASGASARDTLRLAATSEASDPTIPETAERPDAAPLPPLDPALRERLDAESEEQINRLRRKLKQLGPVSAESLSELDELEGRYARLNGQLQDLVAARDTLEEIIRRINAESKRMFVETFGQIRANFQDLFRKLFGGGEGDVVLEDPDDVLECGIDVVARPPGKELRSISLLSGGEKTMTAVALLLAIFKTRPSPFCILDEVDAALDEANVGRYLNVIQEFRQSTQFIIVSHRKPTMAGADVLYGVTMEEAGVSKRMSVRFEDVSEDGQFRTGGRSAPPELESAA
ncbi:MAG: hypothetical protein ACT4QC_20775 [Planctomycetaceae bacterium]